MKADFNTLVDRAMSDPGWSNLRPVIEKELLHYDILFALDKAELLNSLTFQGGTSLRLCCRSSRFSEDLDFVGGKDFKQDRLAPLADILTDHLGKRYGLKASIQYPDPGGLENRGK